VVTLASWAAVVSPWAATYWKLVLLPLASQMAVMTLWVLVDPATATERGCCSMESLSPG